MIEVNAVDLMCVFDDFSENKDTSGKITKYHFFYQREDLVEIKLDLFLREMTATLLMESSGLVISEVRFSHCPFITVNVEYKIVKIYGSVSQDQAPFLVCTVDLNKQTTESAIELEFNSNHFRS